MTPRRLVIGILALVTLLGAIDVRVGGPRVLGAYFEQVTAPMAPAGSSGPDGGRAAPDRSRSHTAAGELSHAARDVDALNVDNTVGNVVVTGSSSDEVKVGYVLTVYADSRQAAEEYARGLEVKLSQKGSSLDLFVERREASLARGLTGIELDYTISLPRGVGVKFGNTHGQVHIAGVDGDVTLRAGSGPATVRQVSGNVDIDCGVGLVEAIDIRGDLKITNNHPGARISNIEGDVTVTSQLGAIDIERVTGKVEAGSGYGSISIRSVSGSVEARSRSGPVDVSDVEGPLAADSTFGSVRAAAVLNSIDLRTQNGPIAVELTRGIGGYDIDAVSQNGRIATTLPLSVSRADETGAESLAGPFDGGKFGVKLRSKYGHIVVTAR